MIRREILLVGGESCWLLVSQIEHARVSFLLARHCMSHFGQSPEPPCDSPAVQQVRNELLQAILHHDDGWAPWEAQPGIDPQLRRPLSFRELPLDAALANWDRSISRAAQIGPLASWTVAGHFAALLEDSAKQYDEALAARWLARTAGQRAQWVSQWQAQDPSLRTLQLAAEALLWLQTFDLLSLWLCSVCPAGGETVQRWPEGYRIAPNNSLGMQVRPDETVANAQRTTVVVDPWRFDVPEIELEAASLLAPIRKYRDSDDLLKNCTPHQLRWKLAPS